MDWQIFSNTVLATGFAAGAFVFLAKALSKHFLSLDFERFKGELKATHERELERLRADLRSHTDAHWINMARIALKERGQG